MQIKIEPTAHPQPHGCHSNQIIHSNRIGAPSVTSELGFEVIPRAVFMMFVVFVSQPTAGETYLTSVSFC